MPGKITEVFVKADSIVKKGDPILILEAMKMENVIRAQMDGQVKKVNVEVGQTVEKGILLVDFEKKED